MKSYFCLIFLLVAFYASSQRPEPQKMGVANYQELKMNTYAKDSSASAVLLHEEVYFHYKNPIEWSFSTDHYIRLKILTKEGLDKANVEIFYSKDQQFLELEAVTYNLDDQEEIITTPVTDENIITSEMNDQIQRTLITFPNVKVGSIIEYRYRISPSPIQISEWYFQKEDVPVIKSIFKTYIPNGLQYFVHTVGEYTQTKRETQTNIDCFETSRFKGRCKLTTYRMDSIPRFEPEPLMPDPAKYQSRLQFQISKSLRPFYRNNIRSWNDFDGQVKKLTDAIDAGMSRVKLDNILPDSVRNTNTKLEQAKKIFEYTRDVLYDENPLGIRGQEQNESPYFSNKIAQTVAAIYLYTLYKSIEIPTNFVYTSEAGSGEVNKKFPTTFNFNYLLLKVDIDGKSYFLDPTNNTCRFGMVSPSILGRDARVMDFTSAPHWAQIESVEGIYKTTQVEFSLDKTNNANGIVKVFRKGYEGIQVRADYIDLGKEKYLDGLEEVISDIEIGLYANKNLSNYDEDFVEEFNFTLNSDYFENTETEENEISIPPILFNQLTTNPFTVNKRMYPIELPIPLTNSYRAKIKIPKGYLYKNPKDVVTFGAFDNGLNYTYTIKSNPYQIEIEINFNIQKTHFSPKEYQELKDFYSKVVDVENYTIKLQKIEE